MVRGESEALGESLVVLRVESGELGVWFGDQEAVVKSRALLVVSG